jgi:hypothetical protein
MPYEVAQAVLDFAPGARTPPQTHAGQVFVTVLDGTITFRTQGTEKTYQAGESFIEQPGVIGQATNSGSANATVLATYLLPKGAPLSSRAPGMPRTGEGEFGPALQYIWLALLLGGGLVAGGWGVRRIRRNR